MCLAIFSVLSFFALFYSMFAMLGRLAVESRSLSDPPLQEKEATEAGRRNEHVSLTLGGFTLTVLAVLLGLGGDRGSGAGFGEFIFNLVLAFTLFLIVTNLYSIRTKIAFG